MPVLLPTKPAAQLLPHLPQLDGSDLVSVQVPLQFVGLLHVHPVSTEAQVPPQLV
jgi:hypothetical protein